MELPRRCPSCGIELPGEALYYAEGIQYVNGSVTGLESNFRPDERLLEIDLEDAGVDWEINPYRVRCGECGHVLWEKHILINEEKFFVKEKQ